ncbi:hypothetical protein vseg_008198 [Gypsophila vaccaria]
MGHPKHGLVSLIILVLTPLVIIGNETALSPLVIAPHCPSKCGNVTIPYPFGIGKGCYFIDHDNPGFYHIMNIKCNHSANPPIPILGDNIPIIEISLDEAEIRLNSYVSFDCYDRQPSKKFDSSLNLVMFTISDTKNMLVATGCDTYAWFSGSRYGDEYQIGCMTICDELDDVVDNDCNGVGCCEASIPDGVTKVGVTVSSFYNHTNVSFNPCSVAFAVAKDEFVFAKQNLTQDSGYYSDYPMVPVVFNWGIGTKNCSEANKTGSCLCKNNTICTDLKPDQDGYRCNCKDGYSGNPYLPQGCKDIDECKGAHECEKQEYCTNNEGSYTCECPKGYHGNATKTHGCSSSTPWLQPVIITAGIGGGVIILLVIGFLLHLRRGERRLKKIREANFRENGGDILHQKVSQMDVLKIFTAQELESATDRYNEVNVIGRGGFGVVYKGVIQDDQLVAIKRSLKVDPNQVEQFINEVLVLSQINNRNVVRLLGCCLETEVPLLVYEFINNGTLYDHLHDEWKVQRFTWNLRLRIASEIADVLSYLHTTISTPIIHRDMKSANILLDESYTAKVADFGASKLVPSDEGQLATMLVGTQGYLDPEYIRTFKLTAKSDVYSFGVVLLELLTNENALSYQKPEHERCLSMHFLLKMKENRLFDIVDKNISDNPIQTAQIKEVANLAKWCLRLKGDDRPTMKEVATELEGIKRMGSPQSRNARISSFDDPIENSRDRLIGNITNDDANTSGKDSDLYSLPNNLVSNLGDGR